MAKKKAKVAMRKAAKKRAVKKQKKVGKAKKKKRMPMLGAPNLTEEAALPTDAEMGFEEGYDNDAVDPDVAVANEMDDDDDNEGMF